MSNPTESNSAVAREGAEAQVRVDLAAAFRLAALHGWDDIILSHMSARIPGTRGKFLMHPADLYFEEVTASNLLLVDEEDPDLKSINPAKPHSFAFPFHKGIYRAFPDANCIVHLHTRAASAVTMQKQGLIPGNQYALWLGPIGYHDYEGTISSEGEGKRLAKAFNTGNIVLQKAHGFVLWGRSVAHAYLLAYVLDRACQCQLTALTDSVEPYLPTDDVIRACVAQGQQLMLDPNGYVCRATWAGALRKLDRLDPSYRS